MANIITELNTYHISTGTYEDFELARGNYFSLIVPASQLTNLYKVHVNPDDADESDETIYWTGDRAAEVLRLSISKAFIPNFSLGKHEVRRGNDVTKYAGVPEFKAGSFAFKDYVGLNTKELLYSWYYKGYNPLSRKGGHMYEYKKLAYLVEYDQSHTLLRYWTLEGLWIQDLQEGDLDLENDDVREMTLAMEYDRAILHSMEESNGTLPF